jgi:SRSO17 transposase
VGGLLDCLKGAFRRRDQARWAAVYLEGLLRPGGRKTVEQIVRTLGLQAESDCDPAQALQHFLNQSPWDDDALTRRCRQRLAPCRSTDGALFVTELAFVKQGRHSVGVQRQFSSALGRKTNCQVAVALFHANAALAFPLTLRLYLPRGWQQDPGRLDAAGVPPGQRQPLTRTDLARQLLDAVAADPVPERVLTCAVGWAAHDDLTHAADIHGLTFCPDVPADMARAVQGSITWLQELGLDHFEGRSWRGFHHHACLVLLAHACRLLHPNGTPGPDR